MSGPTTGAARGTANASGAGAKTASGGALGAFRAGLEAAARERLGVVQLRVKALDESSAFDGNDYDFLSEPRDHARLLALLQSEAKRRGVSFLIDEADPAKTHVQLWDAARRQSIPMDFWKEHGIVRPDDRREVFVRFRDVRSYVRRDGAGVLRLPADLELLLYLCHLDTRRKDLDAAAVLARLAHYRGAALAEPDAFVRDSQQRERVAARLDALHDAASLADASLDSLRVLEQGGLALRRRRLEDDLPVRIRNAVRRRVEARLHHPVVAFVGPDGSGKSTLIERLLSDPATAGTLRAFKHFFRMTRPYATLTRLHPDYRRLEDNLADERLGRVWFVVAVLQYFREMRPSAEAGRVFVDRYFHDLLLSDVRAPGRTARLGGPGRLGVRLFPLPDAVVQLYAPPETLLERKQEVSHGNLIRYGEMVDAIYAARSPRMRATVSTSASVEECVAFLRIVLDRVGTGAKAATS